MVEVYLVHVSTPKETPKPALGHRRTEALHTASIRMIAALDCKLHEIVLKN